MTFDTTSLSSLMLLITAFSAAFLVALWLSLIIWTNRDIRTRSHDPLLRILAVLVVAILFLPGIVVYFILRPHQTVEDEYQRTLEEEALLQSIEGKLTCPGCGRQIEDDWIVCPDCHSRLKKICQQCKRHIELSWDLCPYCGFSSAVMRPDENANKPTIYPVGSAPDTTNY